MKLFRNALLILVISLLSNISSFIFGQTIGTDNSVTMNPDGYIGGLTIKTGAYWYDAGKQFYDVGTKKTMNYTLEVAIPISQVLTVSGFYKQLNHKYSELLNYQGTYMEWSTTDKFYGANVTIYFKPFFSKIF
jgi:hypothetical protein